MSRSRVLICIIYVTSWNVILLCKIPWRSSLKIYCFKTDIFLILAVKEVHSYEIALFESLMIVDFKKYIV